MANEMILVVDADKKSQKVLEVCFKKAGYRVVLADSIVQAMRHVEQTPPSLIISDTVLSDGDGLEFCADLKHNPAYKEIPFVFLTEDRSLPQKMRGFELGADDYLTKPIYIKEVTTRVELLLQKRAKESLLDAEAQEFEGELSDITMIDLLQNIENERLSGSVSIRRGTRQAIIYFREGNLLDAVCGKLQGEDAIYRVMMWPEGHFVVRYHEHLRRVDHIEKPTDALLLEGIHRLDEWNELVAQLPAMENVFALDYQQVSGQIDSFPGEVEQVVRLFDGYRTLHDVVDDSPLEDIVTLHVIGKLLEEKMLNDVTPRKATALNTTVLDASGLNAWLSTDLRDTNPGLPFSQHDNEVDESERIERRENPERSAATDVIADEVATVDLRRPNREQAVEASEDSATGGGHWKFHWNEGDLADLEEGNSDEDEQVSSTSRIAGNAVSTGEWVDEDSDQGSTDKTDNESDSYCELEARETIRRAEEARHLAEQMRQIDNNTAQKQLKSVPVSIEAPQEVVEEAVAEEAVAEEVGAEEVGHVDRTQELFVQPLLDEQSARSDEEFEARSRASTPLSTPAQMIRAIAGSAVDAEWGSFEAQADEQDAGLGEESSSPVVYAARAAVEAREPVIVAGEAAYAADAVVAERETGGPAERREQSIEDAAEVSQESRKERSEKVTRPLNVSALQAERAAEESVEESSEASGAEVSPTDGAEVSSTADALHPGSGALSIEEETSPEDDGEQEHRVASAFESVEEFEAPLFDPVDPLTTSLQSPREGEVVRATFDLEKSGYRNVRGMVLSLADDKSEPEAQKKSEDNAVVAGEGNIAAAEAVDAAVAEDLVQDVAAAEPVVAVDEKPAEKPSESAVKSVRETAEIPKVKSAQIAESAEEDSFFSSIEDPLLEHDEQRAASSNWKVPVLIVGILALIVVLTWNGMKSTKPEVKPVAEVVPAAEVTPAPVKESAGVVEPESGSPEENLQEGAVAGLDEAAALAKATDDSASVEESARGLSEALGAELSAEEAAAEQLAAEALAAEKAAAEALAAEQIKAEQLAAEKAAAESLAAKNSQAAAASAAPSAEPATFDEKVRQLRNLIKRERTGDALKLARTLSEEAPTDRSVAFLHGQAALYERLTNEAVENLARAEKLGMRTSALYLELGQAYQLAGQSERAKQSYEAFLKIQPDGRSADEVRSILKNQF